MFQATLAGVDFVSITLPVALTNATIDAALQQLQASPKHIPVLVVHELTTYILFACFGRNGKSAFF